MRYKRLNTEIVSKVVTIVGIAFALLISDRVAAKEGFSSSLVSAPPAVKSVWPKTFAILTDYSHKYDTGTASLVWKVKTRSSWELYFLTANHVVDQRCEKGNVCPNTFLIQNLTGKVTNNKFTPDPLKWPFFDTVEVIARTANPDLALLRVFANLEATDIPDAMTLPSTCNLRAGQSLYAVGYPATNDRVYPASPVIADKDDIRKRWSSGAFVDKYNDGNVSDLHLYFGTTIDALEGNSGGPVVNADGKIIGVLLKVSDNSSNNGFRYDGNEAPGSLDWHSLSTRCDYLQRLKTYFENVVPK